MTELEKIVYAKSFIDKLANGINPLSDQPVSDEDIVNHIRLTRCFFFVSDVLRQVIDNGGVAPVKSSKKTKKSFVLTAEERERIVISKYPISISEMAKHLNSLVNEEVSCKLSATVMIDWLEEKGFLIAVTRSDGKTRRMPTEEGKALGIFSEERTGQYGVYTTVLYNAQAQQFVYDHIDAVAEYQAARKVKNSSSAEDAGKPWDHEQDERLTQLFRQNKTDQELAKEMRRSIGAIRVRLKRLGLIEKL